jgi:thiol-disulfide isomerase/thioredoxin
MRNVVILAGLIATIPIAWGDDVPETPAGRYRRLAAEYESAVVASSSRPHKAGEGPDTADRRATDPRTYAARFLELAEDHPDSPAALDAMGWVLRHVHTGPEVEMAVVQLGKRHLQDDRLGELCALLTPSVPSETGERLLRRVIEESPHRVVREQACLALAFYETRLAKEARRIRSANPEQKGRWIKALGQARYDQVAGLDPSTLNRQTDHWLRRLVDEDATILRGATIRMFLTFLSTDPAPAADKVIRRITEVNPDRDIQNEARWALAIRQIESARLAAMITTASPEVRQRLIKDWGGDNIAQLERTAPSVRAVEIDRLLLQLADQTGDRVLPRTAFELMAIFTRLSGNSSDKAYHTNVEPLLRRVSETNPDRRARAVASFSLAKWEIGLAQEVAVLKLAPRQAVDYWVARLGEERAEQLRGLDPSILNEDAERLLRGVALDYADVSDPVSFRPVGPQAEVILNMLRGPAIGRAAPEIAGDDVDGKPMKLSDYRGKVVLLNFGCHETCAPCRAMYPYERSLSKHLAGEPFALLGFDVNADARTLLAAMRAEGNTWRCWCENGSGPIASRWVSEGIPLLYLIDREGVIRARYVGFPGKDILDHAIEMLLKGRTEKDGEK